MDTYIFFPATKLKSIYLKTLISPSIVSATIQKNRIELTSANKETYALILTG